MSPAQHREASRGRAGGLTLDEGYWFDDGEDTVGTSNEWRRRVRYLISNHQTGCMGDHDAELCSEAAYTHLIPFGQIERAIGNVKVRTTVARHGNYPTVEPPMPEDLKEALQELDEVAADAEEDGLAVPSKMAFANAERLLRAMYRNFPRRFVVYPVSGGRIAIDARGLNNRAAVVTCDSDGGALCMVTIDGEYRRARYSTTRELPDGFIREALTALNTKPTL